MISRLRQLVSDDQGNSMIEYGLVCALISIAAVLVLQALAPIVLGFWQQIVDGVATAG
jgi:Flp pilus assembly pilin Flp